MKTLILVAILLSIFVISANAQTVYTKVSDEKAKITETVVIEKEVDIASLKSERAECEGTIARITEQANEAIARFETRISQIDKSLVELEKLGVKEIKVTAEVVEK